MPHGNRTGPEGQGPRTGRQQGHCSGFDSPGYTNSIGGGNERMGMGMGMRSGMGRGRGFRKAGGIGFGRGVFRGLLPSRSQKDELTMLKTLAEELKNYQENIQKRIVELEKQNDSGLK